MLLHEQPAGEGQMLTEVDVSEAPALMASDVFLSMFSRHRLAS